MVGVQEVIHIKKSYLKTNDFFPPLLMSGMGCRIFFRTSLVPSIT